MKSNDNSGVLMSLCIRTAIAAAMFVVATTPIFAGEPSPPGAKEYIIWPKDGALIKGGKFWLRMGLANMGVAPAGVAKPETGHHHLLIDVGLPPLDEPIPNDANHLHFGKGQTEVRLELPPGKHTLQLILGDKDHVPHSPPVYSEKISITVE